jgi:hypothetical protein
MVERDNFSKQTKQFVALRAGHQCSLTGCPQRTAGPSEESATAVAIVGDAAHICAAAPGGRRYVASMSPEERSHIDNAIWLCATHARLVDRDEVTFTIEGLRQMRRDRESACAREIRLPSNQSVHAHDLIAVGPEIVCTGELLGINGAEWSLHISNFVSGDFHALIAYGEKFPQSPRDDRYIIVNALGDGRVLAAAPNLTKSESGYLLQCRIEPRFPRIAAQKLGSQPAISRETGDLFLEKGSIARVAGLDSLPQHIRQCLSMLRGESPFHPDFGARLAQYFDAFRASPWLGHFLKLDVIRQAAIPYTDELMGRQYTPLQCVDRVWGVEVLADTPKNQRLPILVDFDVHGVGRWQHEISIFICREVKHSIGPDILHLISAPKTPL